MRKTRRDNHKFAPHAATLRGLCLKGCAIAVALSSAMTTPVQAETFPIISGGGFAHLNVESIRERKWANIVRQQYDFSCGSAAVATLLTYHYNKPTKETEAFQTMWKVGNKQRIQQVGFSLLEMKTYLESLGYKADGFKLTVDRLREVGVPGIALVDIKGYKHFVVIKGITERTVLYGDPSKGLSTRSVEDFEEIWDGVILFVRSQVSIGKSNFNSLRDWKRAPSGPFDRGVDLEPLAQQFLSESHSFNQGFSLPQISTDITTPLATSIP